MGLNPIIVSFSKPKPPAKPNRCKSFLAIFVYVNQSMRSSNCTGAYSRNDTAFRFVVSLTIIHTPINKYITVGIFLGPLNIHLND